MTLLIQYTLIFASVLMLVALGGCFAERSGVINIGLEGIMMMSALFGSLTSYWTGSWFVGLLVALIVGVLEHKADFKPQRFELFFVRYSFVF